MSSSLYSASVDGRVLIYEEPHLIRLLIHSDPEVYSYAKDKDNGIDGCIPHYLPEDK